MCKAVLSNNISSSSSSSSSSNNSNDDSDSLHSQSLSLAKTVEAQQENNDEAHPSRTENSLACEKRQSIKETTAEEEEATAATVLASTGKVQQSEDSRKQKKLQFTTIQIRKYDKTLGDNPAVSNGPPIQLDWTYIELPVISLDDYETNRIPRRPRKHLSLSAVTRKNSMYYHFGYSHEEIDRAADAVKKIKKQRELTKRLSKNVEKTQEVVQNVTRRIKRTFSREKIYYSSQTCCKQEAFARLGKTQGNDGLQQEIRKGLLMVR